MELDQVDSGGGFINEGKQSLDSANKLGTKLIIFY